MSIPLMNLVWKYSKSKASSRLVLIAIADYSNERGDAWPSMATLSRKAGLSERQCRRCLHKLEQLGELRIERGKGPYHTHIYRVTTCPVDNMSRGTDKAFKGDTLVPEGGTCVSTNPPGEPKKESEDTPPLPPKGESPALSCSPVSANSPDNGKPAQQGGSNGKLKATWRPDVFERLYKAWPDHRKDWAPAVTAWNELKATEEEIEAMKQCFRQSTYSHDWSKDHGKWIPSLAKWLNERRWEHSLPPVWRPTSVAMGG